LLHHSKNPIINFNILRIFKSAEQWYSLNMAQSIQENKQDKYLFQTALDKLAEIHKIIFENNQDIFSKKPEEVSVDSLRELSVLFPSLSKIFKEANEEWFGSKLKGFDGVIRSEKLEDRLDIKVCQTDRLDLKHMEKIMIRMNRLDDALDYLERISFNLKYFEDLCKQKGLTMFANVSEIFRVFSIEEFIKSLRIEAKQQRNQVERSNLYYQAKLNTKTLRIAYLALGVSVLFALFAVLGLLLR